MMLYSSDFARLKHRSSKASSNREWAAGEFDAAQKRVLTERSAFFDRLALFHTGTIAATITFSGILHQVPKVAIQWKWALFTSWIALFLAMIAALIRNWFSQNSWFYTTAAEFEKHEGESKVADANLALAGGRIVDERTGSMLDPSKVKEGSSEVGRLHSEKSRDYKKQADRSDRIRSWSEKVTFAATAIGVAAALAFAMRNFV